MTLDKVVDEIINSAKKDAEKIRKEGKDEAKKILTKAKENSKNIETNALKDAEKMIEAIKRRELASTKLQSKRIELDTKKELIDKVFASLSEKISALDDKTKKKIYETIAKNASSEIAPKVVYSNSRDIPLLESITTGLKNREEDMLGGMIVENEDGSIRVDYTFDSILEEIKDEYLKDISGILFKK